MNHIPDAQLTHVGLFVHDLESMAGFYASVFGMVRTDEGSNYRGDRVVFLSRSPQEHHQLVLAAGRGAGQATTVQQVSFNVAGLEALKIFYPRLEHVKADQLVARTHGNAWSIYFLDPEGNRVEIYAHTPWHVSQPYGKDLDLSEPVAVIHDKTLAMIRDDPSFAPREQWAAALRARIDAA